MSCTNCCKCFQQANGSIVKRGERNGEFTYTLADLTIATITPVDFITTMEVDCSKFDLATLPPRTIQVLEEVDVDGKQTGVLVQVRELADGSTEYVDLSTGSAYTAPVGSTLHTSEDSDYNERTLVLCDSGVDVVSTTIYRDGDMTDIVSSTITKLDGSVHTLSGNERAGSCSGLTKFDQENACFLEVGNINAITIRGYIQFITNTSVTPAVTNSTWFDQDDAELVKADYNTVECC